MTNWIRFIDVYPEESHCPFWVYDTEYETLELVGKDEDRLFPRQDCCKKELLWAVTGYKVKRPTLPKDDL